MGKLRANTEVFGIVRKVSVRNFANGSVLEFDIPINSKYKDKTTGEWKETDTEWYSCQIWGKPDDKGFQNAVSSITEGVFINIYESERITRTDQAKDGSARKYVKYKVHSYYVPNAASGGSKAATQAPVASNAADGDDLPF